MQAMTERLDEWLLDSSSLAGARREVAELGAQVAQTGGIARAADAVLKQFDRERPARIAA